MFSMKNTTAMADYELRHIEALRKDLAGCTVLLKKDGAYAEMFRVQAQYYIEDGAEYVPAEEGGVVHE